MGDFFSNYANTVMNGVKSVGDAVSNELGKMGDRTIKNTAADYKEVADSINKNGILGGVGAIFDVSSPGHATMEVLDDLGVGPSDKNLKQGIAGGINILTGGPYALVGIAEELDALSGLKAGGVPGTNMPQAGVPGTNVPQPSTPMAPSQGNQPPSQAQADAHARALAEAKEKARINTAFMKGFEAGERTQARKDAAGIIDHALPYTPSNGGYAAGPTYGDGGGSPISNFRQYYGDPIFTAVGDKMSDIMNDPGMSFEDKIFLLMTRLVSKEESAISSQTQQLLDDGNKKQDQINALNTQIQGFQNPDDPACKKLIDQRDQLSKSLDNSRQDGFQKIEQATKKLQEMQQALDGILNAMHDTSMNTIQHIK